ncbi:glycoside hydrolase family 5 protein [Candidatus Latescibacterota bacterium]
MTRYRGSKHTLKRISRRDCLTALTGMAALSGIPMTQAMSRASAAWGPYRGANTQQVTEDDVRDFAAFRGNLLRLSFPNRPFINLNPPYNFIESVLSYLQDVLDWSEKYGVDVVIDPHKYPGTEHPWTMLSSDPFWRDFVWHEKVIALWERISKDCAGRGNVVAGYDLLNEPDVREDAQKDSPGDLNLFYRKCIDAIRKHDTRHPIVVASPRYRDTQGNGHSYLAGVNLLERYEDDNIVYEVHCYSPIEFTHQGVQDRPEPVAYPGTVNGVLWNRAALDRLFQPTVEFKKRHNVPIFMGEFSSPKWTGNDGNSYIGDVIGLCEQYGFSWAYHAYREAWVWDAEMDNEDKDARERLESTPRLELLKRYYRRNG